MALGDVVDPAWLVAQIGLAQKQTGEALADMPAVLAALDADDIDDPVCGDPAELLRYADGLVDCAKRVEALAESLPARAIPVDRERLANSAAHAVREGIPVPDVALWAMTFLSVGTGLPALAKALETTDARETWEGLTLADMVDAAPDGTAGLAELIARSIGLATPVVLASCTHEQVTALAAALRSVANKETL